MKDEVKQHSWKVGQATHEGFPLLLRYPDDIEYENPKSRFPILLTITHKLALVQDSGLPERTYNGVLAGNEREKDKNALLALASERRAA